MSLGNLSPISARTSSSSVTINRLAAAKPRQIGNGLDVSDDDAGWHGSDPDEALASPSRRDRDPRARQGSFRGFTRISSS